MFGQFFVWMLQRFSEVFTLFKNIKIDTNFSYFDLCVCIAVAFIVKQLLDEIRKEKENSDKWFENKERNKEYNEYQRKLKSYERESDEK